MLHSPVEIEAFKQANIRLINLGENLGVRLTPGIFLYNTKNSMQNIDSTINNQKKHRFEILQSQISIQYEDSLIYPANKNSLAKKAIEATAKMIEYSNQDRAPVISTQPGIMILDNNIDIP